jgi:Glycosyl transferases group 1
VLRGPTGEAYAVFLVCAEIDGFGHNAVFAQEIAAVLAECGLPSRVVDYRREIRQVQAALHDERCAFLICFNGFGSELSLATGSPGGMASAFGHYRKLLFDLMHDCPSHESMAHQMCVVDPMRQLLLTDYGYVQEAQELGVPNVWFVPSITFPVTLPPPMRTRQNRPIQALFPVRLPPPSSVGQRFRTAAGYRQRIFREVYEAVTERCVADLAVDPRVETRRACREAGVVFDARDADCRFLLTSIVDHTKYARRHELVRALRGLPVTIVTTADAEKDLAEGILTVPSRTFRELLALMSESLCVLCPLPHMTGYHERALGAFTAGAAVLTAPNQVLETQFRDGQDMLVYRSAPELAELLHMLLADPDRLQNIAQCGQQLALDRFSPRRLAETMLSIQHTHRTT